MVEQPCPICGGAGGDWTWACCGNAYPDRHGNAVCCDSPVQTLVNECLACGGSGKLVAFFPQPKKDSSSDE